MLAAESTSTPLPDFVRPLMEPKLLSSTVPTESEPAGSDTLNSVASDVPCRPRRIALLLPEVTTIVLVTGPLAVTVPPRTRADAVLAKPPFILSVPPASVRLRRELNWPSVVMLPPALIVMAGVLVAVAAPHVSVPAMPSEPPLLTVIVLPALLPRLMSTPPLTAMPPLKVLPVFWSVSVPEERTTPPEPVIVRVKLPP